MAYSYAGADVLDGPLVLRNLQAEDRTTRMLASLQSNIIHPHVRSHLRLLGLRIEDALAARRALAGIASDMKSAAQQIEELRAFRASRQPGSAFVGIGLSAAGYARLGVDRARWPDDPAFVSGMRGRDLGDPDPGGWEAPYREGLDAIVLVGSHSDELTERGVARVLAALGSSARVLADETGSNLTNTAGDGIEHFGYVDGRSQPLFIDDDLEVERTTGDGVEYWNPLVALSHVLVADPGVEDGDHAHGSYLVYRKLEQHVRTFKEQETRIAGELGLTDDDEERAGALLIGRFEDGTPVTRSSSADGMRPIPNDFTYVDDPVGAKCPFGAHIRRVNERIADPQARIVIARRGQGYGLRTDDPSDSDLASKPEHGHGLLFMAVVARIEQQFEVLQHRANGDDGGPFDAVLGQRRAQAPQPHARLSADWDSADESPRSCALDPVVTLLGGEYCFLPSIDFLRSLGASAARAM